MINELIIPCEENDLMCFQINGVLKDIKAKLNRYKDDYIVMKNIAFRLENTDPSLFEVFSNDRPSLRNIDKLKNLNGSIYTKTVRIENNLNYEQSITRIKELRNKFSDSRRIIVRIIDDFMILYKSHYDESIDVSCLSFIHYFKNSIRFIFRASDIKNELIPDLLTLCTFFVEPVFNANDNIDIFVFASTAQNVKYYEQIIIKIKKIEV